MSVYYDSPPPSWYEPPEPRWACMECDTGFEGTLAELDDGELLCPECGSSDIDLYSRVAGG
jgi:anaerobic ribonucleoside-triphosphate reductase